jgi:hypothetical protein
VALRAVRACAIDISAGVLDLAVEVAEATGFLGAAGGVVLGIEVENDRLALEIGQVNLLIVSVR